MLLGGSDAAVRYWDAARPDASYVVCAPLWPWGEDLTPPLQGQQGATAGGGGSGAGLNVPQYRYLYRACSFGQVGCVEELCLLDGTTPMAESCQELRGKVRACVHMPCMLSRRGE